MASETLKELTSTIVKKRIAKTKNDYDELRLDGFGKIEEDAASLIAEFDGSVDLRDLSEVSDTTLTILAKHKGSIDLAGLKELSLAHAKAISQHSGYTHLGILTITDEAALALSQGPALFKLTMLTKLDGSPGHIALAKKLVKDGTHDQCYNLKDISQALLNAVPEMKRK